MHLEIIQSDLLTENVDKAVVQKLYELTYENEFGHTSPLDSTSILQGKIHTTAAYENWLTYLNTLRNTDGHFKTLLLVTATSQYIYFQDSNVESALINAGIGDGTGITLADAATATLGTIFKNNTSITSFDEFDKFTRANTSPSALMFYGCINLSQINLTGITTLAEFQFSKSGITEVNAPNLNTISGFACFDECQSLTSVTNLGNVQTIRDSTFLKCYNLLTVILPQSCTVLEMNSFRMVDLDGALTSITGLNRIVSFGGTCLYRLRNLLLTAADLAGAQYIGHGAFWYVPISSINCPKLTTTNGGSQFRENNYLTSVECLGKILTIPGYAFHKDGGLLTVKIPYECTTIDEKAFELCSVLTSVTQYNKSLDNYAEGETPTFTNLSRVTTFGNSCFANCSLLSLSATDLSGAITIGDSAFYNCASINIPTLDLTNVSTIGTSAFFKCNIGSVIWSSSAVEIPSECFSGSKITNISNIDRVTRLKGRCIGLCLLQLVLYFKNVETTCIFGTNTGGSTAGHIFTHDSGNGTAYALYMPKTKDLFGSNYSGNWYSAGFFGSRGSTIIPVVYFKDLEEVYPCSFGTLKCTSLIINNATPPTWYNTLKKTDQEVASSDNQQKKHAFPDNCTITNIYVPDSAVSTYTSDPDWSTLIAKGVTFKSMNELTHYNTEADWITAGKPVTGIIDAYMS